MSLRRKTRPVEPEDQPVPQLVRPTVRPVGTVRMATAADIARRAPQQPVHEAPSKPRPRTHTPAESAHLGRVKALRCVLCIRLQMAQESPTDAHHPRTGQGGAQRAPDWLAAALCHDRCHQGDRGLHGEQSLLRQAKCDEMDLVADTLQALFTGKQP